MKEMILFAFLMMACCSFAQDLIKPFAKIDESFPLLVNYVKAHDLTKMDGDTVMLNISYSKLPYSRSDDTWGYVDGDVYSTFSSITYCDSMEVKDEHIFYLRDYKNQKPTRFALRTEKEVKETIKKGTQSGDTYWFFQPEKFVINVSNKNGKTFVTLKRAHIPQYMWVSLDCE